LGTIAPAKFADMLIVDADPLKEIQNLRKIHVVIEDGKTYTPDELLQQIRSQANKKALN
jgi:imidazolonepropionase-like amidohydrolase